MTAFRAVPPLRGRESEVAALDDTLDRLASGCRTVAIVEGEAGIGKTRLLAEALAAARMRNVQVFAARAEELERTRPFGVLIDAFGCSRSSPDPPRAALAELLTPQAGEHGPITVSSDPGLRFQAVDAFVDLAEAQALRGPVLLGVDDAQWADSGSLLVLNALTQRLADLPLGLICCLRSAPRVKELSLTLEALDAAGAQHLRLQRLSERTVLDLAGDVVDAEPDRQLMAQLAAASGNPLFVIELLAALSQEGAIRTAAGRAEVAKTSLPPTLRLTILRRLSFLPDVTLEALRLASILGATFSLTDVAATTTRSAFELSAALGDAIAGQVLEDDGGRLRFRHDLIRDAIYEDIPESLRRGLHREAGQRLASSAAPALQVAGHMARGAVRGDAEAITWLTTAAREVAPSSPSAAAELLQGAVELTDPADPSADRLRSELAVTLMWAGRLADAEATCRALLEREHDPAVDGPIRACLAQLLIAHGRPIDALHQLDGIDWNAIDQSTSLTDAEKAAAWGWASIAHLSAADLDQAESAARTALAVSPAGDDVTTSMAMSCLVFVLGMRAQLRDALRISDDAVRLADRSPHRAGHRYQVLLTRGQVLLGLGQLQ